MTEDGVRQLLKDVENYDLEFKSAQASYNELTLNEYCAAIANENGGYLLLGISNDRKIIGTKAFEKNWNALAHKITKNVGLRVKVYNVSTSDGRVLAFEIPRHSTGTPCKMGLKSKYTYPIRDGESLVEMHPDALRAIFAEKDGDWSQEIAKGVEYNDLDESAIKSYRFAWAKHIGDSGRDAADPKKMLRDLGLMINNGITNAALLLFGTPHALARVIPDAEIIFEWRNNAVEISFGERKNWRAGFMLIKDELWDAVNARNTVFRYQSGFTQRGIPAFDEDSVRESIVNAFTHRDYTISGSSIVIKASPEEFYIENPGNLMPGVTLENMIDKSVWRNRLLAESLEKVRIMERSSQGVDKIYTHTIRDGKGIPEYKLRSDPALSLRIPATLKDQSFVDFLEQVSQRQQDELSIKEIIELEQIRQGTKGRGSDLRYKDKFLTMGIIERVGQGRGSRYILSHQYYGYAGDPGKYTRLSGLARNVKRTLILNHLDQYGKVTNSELQEAMPDLQMEEIYRILKAMKKDNLIEHAGSKRYGYWEKTADYNSQLNLLETD
jgi:ATP-dependent DNA helicase RecG